MFLVSLRASLRSANDHLVRLWPRCDFSTLCNAKILFHTRAQTFCVCISCVVNNIESKFHLRTTCGRREIKPYSYISLMSKKFCTKIYFSHLHPITGGVLKFQPQASTKSRIITVESFHKLQIMVGKDFQMLYLAFCWTLGIQILTNFL